MFNVDDFNIVAVDDKDNTEIKIVKTIVVK